MRICVLAPALSEFRLHPMNESSVIEAKMISDRHGARNKIGGMALCRITPFLSSRPLAKQGRIF
jgi:hypothetical protein